MESRCRNRSNQRMQGIVDTLGALQNDLALWGAREFGSLRKNVQKLQKKLERMRGQSIGRGPSDEEKDTVKKLREAMHQEEV